MTSGTALLRRLARNETAASIVEFAMALPILMALVAGLANVAQRMSVSTQVQAASEAGVRYASKSGFDATAITNVVENSSALPNVKASPAPALACICWSAGGGKTTIVCGSKCLDGRDPTNYAVISARVSYQDPFPFLRLSNSGTVEAQTWTRLQ